MNVSTVVESDSVQVQVAGELDALTVSDLVPVLDRLLQSGQLTWRIDLSGLRMIDSSGVVALTRLHRKVRERGGEMSVDGATEQPLEVLRLLHLDRIMQSRR